VGRLYAIIGLLLFLYVGYWFISHSFVIVRLTSVFGLMALVAVAIVAIVSIRRLL
jgi:hypothetical protein